MRILVTGAGGFTGLNLVKKLVLEGHDVYGLTKRVIEFSHPKLHLIIKDLFDINDIEGLDVDVIYHIAARVNFDESESSISQLTRDNIISTSNLADFAVKNKVKKFIYSSSCSVYRENYNRNELISEKHHIRPINLYAVSKLTSEWILENKLRDKIDEFIVLRYSSIYGYGQRASSIVPIFIDNAINNKDLNILGSGNRVQDYVFIDDVIQANHNCLEYSLPFNTILNIGSGEQITDLILAKCITDIWNSSSEINVLDKLDSQETYFNYDIKKAQKLIGFQPMSLIDGLKKYENRIESK
jgi:UDP-glucose 4-epimerase